MFDVMLLFEYAIALIGFLFAFLLRFLWNSLNKTKENVELLKNDMHQHFVRKDEFKEAINDLKLLALEERRMINARFEAQSGLLFQILDKLGYKQNLP